MKRKIQTSKKILFICIALYSGSMVAVSDLKIGVIGTGYVGLVLGTCLAEHHTVVCADIDKSKIAQLKNNKLPIYEPGLEEMVVRYQKNGSLHFSDNPGEVVRSCSVVFIAVNTPMSPEGEADLTAINAVANTIGKNLNGYKVIVTKSTVPVGTGRKIRRIIERVSGEKHPFDVCSNPEFLREGVAVGDFMNPERIVFGIESDRARAIMDQVYKPYQERGIPCVYTNIQTAETIKYASNAFLAVKVAFINQVANFCESRGAIGNVVAEAMGLDSRIGKKFLQMGPGFGGSCFPKDTHALIKMGDSSAESFTILKAALDANDAQKIRVFKKLERMLGQHIEGKKIAVLGLAFKANTDDIRYSPAITLIKEINNAGGLVYAYDPVATENMSRELSPVNYSQVHYCKSVREALRDADAAVIVTEWQELKNLDLKEVKELMKKPILLDARNVISVAKARALGFMFDNIGNAEV